MKKSYFNRYVYPSDVPIRKAADGSVLEREHGMTLWDHYAGQALAGLCADPSIQEGSDSIAERSAMIADAMLAEREKRGVEG